MNKYRSRLTRAAAEELLDGRSLRTDTVAEIVAAARADAMQHEVRGIDAALAAFATATPSASAIEPERRTPVLKRLVTAKVIGAAIGAVALGGVAIAAGTGSLPSPLPHSDHAASTASSHVPQALPTHLASRTHDADESTGAASPAAESSESAKSSEASESSSESKSSSATPSPSLPGLCQSWLSRPHENGNADSNPAFTVLVQKAGGKDSVNAFCTSLLATAGPTHPTHPAHPTFTGQPVSPGNRMSHGPVPPNHANNVHDTGSPTSLPSAVPTPPAGS